MTVIAPALVVASGQKECCPHFTLCENDLTSHAYPKGYPVFANQYGACHCPILFCLM